MDLRQPSRHNHGSRPSALAMNHRSLVPMLRVVLLVCFLTLPQQTIAADSLTKKLDDLLAQPHFKTAHWGFLFVDLKTGEVVLEKNSDKLFAPASTTKLFST